VTSKHLLFVPIIQVVWQYHFSPKSAAEHGTLYQLRNSTNVVSVSIDNFDACEDFFTVVVEAHIIIAVMHLLGMKAISDYPSAQHMLKISGHSLMRNDKKF